MFEMRPYHNNRRNNMAAYNPFREMDAIERSFFGDPFGFFGSSALEAFKTDIVDNGKEYVLEADLPGFDKKDIHLDIKDDVLTIHAERKAEREETNEQNNYVRCERSWGSYSRQFDLSGIDADSIRAKYENGVLTLTMPKKEQYVDTSRHLEIE
ncbi:MAG: Hsp20/alpha crystallin family protein [Hominenteromicrobium sp.]